MNEVLTPFIVAYAVSATVLLGFETWAIVTKRKGGTISEMLRAILGINPQKPWRWFGIAAVVGFSVWFPLHIILEN